jgi:hypothetical protein
VMLTSSRIQRDDLVEKGLRWLIARQLPRD